MRHDARLPHGRAADAPTGSRSMAGTPAAAGTNWARRSRRAPAFPAPGSQEEFITEHYWGYTRQRDGSTVEYQVEHPQWRVWSATDARFSCDVAAVYGTEYTSALGAAPASAFVADGSPVTVRRGVPLRTP